MMTVYVQLFLLSAGTTLILVGQSAGYLLVGGAIGCFAWEIIRG